MKATIKSAWASLAIFIGATTSVYGAETSQAILDDSFRSLQVTVEGYPFAPPVISLNNPADHILISFDELAEDRSYLRYELTHCDARWQPEGLVDSEFLEGFNQGDVTDYDFSRSTTVHYVNYRITIPNEQMAPLIAGNYLLRVYREDDPDTTLLRARFSVSDDTINLSGGVTTRTDIDTNSRHQQVEIVADDSGRTVEDIFNDLKVIVVQNGRADNAVTVTHPLRVEGRRAVFEHLRPLIFDAGNEYRRMETVSVNYRPMHVGEIVWADPLYHFVLETDTPRTFSPYSYDQTQHGRYFIREYNSSQSDVEADYGVVHFALEMPQLKDADIYIDGDMTQRRFDPSSRMTYNSETGRYKAALLLKQGAYNYQYLAVRNGTAEGATSPVEGDKWETVNEYTVYVYHRPRGSRYDRLAGVTTIFSNK